MRADSIDQLVVHASLSSSATRIALRLRTALRGSVVSNLIAVLSDPVMTADVLSLELAPTDSRGLLLYHAGLEDSRATRWLLAKRSPLVIMWHSLGSDATVGDWARYELGLLCPASVASVATSAAGVSVLESAGFRDVHLMPMSSITTAEAPPTTSAWVEESMQLSLGRRPYLVAIESATGESKNELVVQSVSVLQRVLGREIGLVMICDDATTTHARVLIELAQRLGVEVVWLPANTPIVLDVVLSNASVVVATGLADATPFALQAMSMGTPVIIAASRADVATIQGALAMQAEAGPVVLAEVIDRLLIDHSARAALAARGQRFTHDLKENDSAEQLVELLQRLAQGVDGRN